MSFSITKEKYVQLENPYHQILNFLNQQECLRLKIIERLLKEGSTADEPINIQLSDYSSDEGSSSNSDNEAKSARKDFSDLEGSCCHPLRVPPCSPETNCEARKLRNIRVRKVMQELDRIYFQPQFRKKFRAFIKTKRSPIMKKRKRTLNRKAKSLQSFPQDPRPQILKQEIELNTTTSEHVEIGLSSNSGNIERFTSLRTLKAQGSKQIKNRKERLKRDQSLNKKFIVKVSRKLRLWLSKRQIFIVRRNMRHKLKFRLKTLHRPKKHDRLLLDMPTTDPGSDLPFSTDDEYIDANAAFTCYGKMPSRVRRHLLKSELQRRYIDEIGDGLQNMPPELIVTSPTNKAAEIRKSQAANGLPFLNGQMTKRTRSLPIQNTASLSPIRTTEAKTKDHNAFYRPLWKKKVLSKEDLDIKLSLKKKVWSGIQLDDQSRSLGWVAPQTLKSKKLTGNKIYSIEVNSNIKKLENEAFLTACSRKLMEWKMTTTNADVSPFDRRPKVPLKIVVPSINHDGAICIFKHVANVKTCKTTFSAKPNSETNRERVLGSGKSLTKLAKSKLRNSLSTSHRAFSKIDLDQRKSHIRSNFQAGRLVVTAMQTGISGGTAGGIKKSKKFKSIHQKLPNINSNTIISSKCNINNKSRLVMPATTNIVKRVKTKFKRKTLASNTTPKNIP